MKEKYGFVYIWRDSKHKRYYIGCRWGHIDDGYICSSSWMKSAYKRRPDDFKRRVIESNISSISLMFEREYYWLKQIEQKELGTRYYNLHNRFQYQRIEGYTLSDISRKRMSASRKKMFEQRPDLKEQIREFQKNQWNQERKRKWSERTKRQWDSGVHNNNQKRYRILKPDNSEVEIVNLDQFCREHNLVSRLLRRRTHDGKRYKGYQILEIGERQ
jgi:hypothetical protein